MRNLNERVIKSSARESIDHLIKQAEKEYKKRPSASKRYVKMAWDLVKKNKVRLNPLQKLKFCKKCHEIWMPGRSVSVSFDKKNNLFIMKCKCGYSRKTGPVKN